MLNLFHHINLECHVPDVQELISVQVSIHLLGKFSI